LTLTALADKYRLYHDSGELNFTVVDQDAVMAKLRMAYKGGKQDELDGLSVNYDDWWFNVRPSNTEPLLRLNVEAKTVAKLREETGKLKAIIEGSASY
jgi:phosphomannomutase